MQSNPVRRRTYAVSCDQDFVYDRILRSFLYSRISEHLRSLSNPKPLVLDLGCGEQPLRAFIEDLGAHYISADITQNSSNTVDYIFDLSSSNASHLIPYEFDLIILSEVLEHVTDPSRALRHARSILKPLGIILITTPFIWPLHEAPHDYQRLTRHWFEYQSSALNLRILAHESLGSPADVLHTILLKTHLFASHDYKLGSLVSRIVASFARCVKSVLVWILSNDTTLGLHSSSQLYLVNCLILSSDGPISL